MEETGGRGFWNELGGAVCLRGVLVEVNRRLGAVRRARSVSRLEEGSFHFEEACEKKIDLPRLVSKLDPPSFPPNC